MGCVGTACGRGRGCGCTCSIALALTTGVPVSSITRIRIPGALPGFSKAHAWSGFLQCTHCLQDGLISQMAPDDTTVGRTQEEELARLYHIPIPKQTDLPISYNIAPSQKVLTIRFNPKTQARRSLDALQWGLIPYWAKDPKIAYRTIMRELRQSIKRPRIGKLSRNGAA